MYYNGSKIFLVSFLVSLVTSVVVCLIFLFLVPINRASTEVQVPDFTGSTFEQARVIAESRSLLLVLSGEEESEKFGENLICRQAPLPGSNVRSKSTVTVFVSKGSSQMQVPDLKGMGVSEAIARLASLGLKIGDTKTQEDASIDKDKIITTIPPAGTKVKKDEAVTIVVSQGIETVDVPRLIGRALSTAKRLVEEKGLVVGNVTYEVSTEIDVGIVMRQSPVAGAKAKKGSRVDIVVATVLDQ
jgi:serine/threonine-protein kinase